MSMGRQALSPPRVKTPGTRPKLQSAKPKFKLEPNIRGLGGL